MSDPAPRTVHELKTWTDFFQAIADGRKNFEVRYDDRGFQAGDRVKLIEIDNRSATRQVRTGRIAWADIGFVMHQPVWDRTVSFNGYVVFSLLNIEVKA